MSHQKLIGIRSISPIAVQLPWLSRATPFDVFGPFLKIFDTILFVRYHETVEYIPSPPSGEMRMYSLKVRYYSAYFVFFLLHVMLLHANAFVWSYHV